MYKARVVIEFWSPFGLFGATDTHGTWIVKNQLYQHREKKMYPLLIVATTQ